MGIATGEKGQIYLTDMDSIEKSNLNRQVTSSRLGSESSFQPAPSNPRRRALFRPAIAVDCLDVAWLPCNRRAPAIRRAVPNPRLFALLSLRQFLFRPADVGQLKSKSAAKVGPVFCFLLLLTCAPQICAFNHLHPWLLTGAFFIPAILAYRVVGLTIDLSCVCDQAIHRMNAKVQVDAQVRNPCSLFLCRRCVLRSSMQARSHADRHCVARI
jgi:hypothetical protein